MAAVSTAQVHALAAAANGELFAHKSGANDVKGIARQTVASLIKAGYAQFNGAARTMLTDRRSARKVEVTSKGLAVLVSRG